MERRIDINDISQIGQDELVRSALELFKPDFEKLTDKNGMRVLPADILDWQTGHQLMQGFMNLQAFRETLITGKVTFWQRTDGRLWTKGETSENYLIVKAIITDCDQDTFTIYAQPLGPTCHTGTTTCYDNSPVLYFDPDYQIPNRVTKKEVLDKLEQ